MSTSRVSKGRYHHGNLAPVLVAEALVLVEAEGVGALSLREVAKRAAVSPTAVYRHFADKNALLMEIAAEGFAALNAAFATVPASAPDERLRCLGEAYVAFALAHPDLYRLMFTAARPSLPPTPRLLEQSGRSLATLTEAVAACRPPDGDTEAVSASTVAAWSLVHGFVLLVLEGPLNHLPPNAMPDVSALLARFTP